jgi:hypothetical protein
MNVILAGAIVLSSLVAARPSATIGPPVQCSNSQSSHGVAIQSCSYTLESSPAGNPNYFVNVTLKYATPSPTTPVRFRCTLANASTNSAQYGVLRLSGSTLKFISPFVSSSSALKSVRCAVDAT